MSVLFYFSLDHSKLTNAEHCGGGGSLSKQFAKGYNCACAVCVHTCPFCRGVEVLHSTFSQPFLPLFCCLRVTACSLPLPPALKPSLSLSSTVNSEVSGEETLLQITKARLTPKQSGSTRLSGQYIDFQSTSHAILETLHTSCDQAQRAGDSLAVTEAMYANAILEALHTSCDQAWRAGEGRTIRMI